MKKLGIAAATVSAAAAVVGLWPAIKTAYKRSDIPIQDPTMELSDTQNLGPELSARDIGVITVGDGSSVGDIQVTAMLTVEARVEQLTKRVLEKHAEELGRRDATIEALQSALLALVVAQQSDRGSVSLGRALSALDRGETRLAQALFRETAERKQAEGERANKDAATAYRHLGAIAYLTDTNAALEAYRNATRLDPSDPEGWNFLGHLLERSGDLVEAEHAYERVLGVAGERRVWRARALNNLGIIEEIRGNMDKAERNFGRALEHFEKARSREGMAIVLSNLGRLYRLRGDLDEAEEAHMRALRIERELGRAEGIAFDLSGLGLVYEAKGRLEEAETYHRQALALESERGNTEGAAICLGNLGNIYRARGQLSEAEQSYRRSLALFDELGSREGVALNLEELGHVHRSRGDLKLAKENWVRSLALFREVGAASKQAEIQQLIDEL